MALTILTLVPLVAAGCARSAGTTGTTSASTSIGGQEFPVTVTDCSGNPTTVAEAPAKVVTANLAALELLIRLGRADRVAGTGWAAGAATLPDDIRAAAQSVPALSTGGIPKEVLLTAGATAYIDAFGSMQMMGGDAPTDDDYANAGIDHLFLASSACAATLPGQRTDLGAVYADITTLGRVLDAPEAANTLVEKMKTTIADTAAAHPVRPDRPTVFYFSPDNTTQGMTTVGGKQIANAIYQLAGARNVFEDETTSMRPVSWEDVIAADPDYIQIATRNKATTEEQTAAYLDAIAALQADPRARDLRAVREGRFIDLGAEETTLPGIANADAVAALADAINAQ